MGKVTGENKLPGCVPGVVAKRPKRQPPRGGTPVLFRASALQGSPCSGRPACAGLTGGWRPLSCNGEPSAVMETQGCSGMLALPLTVDLPVASPPRWGPSPSPRASLFCTDRHPAQRSRRLPCIHPAYSGRTCPCQPEAWTWPVASGGYRGLGDSCSGWQ